jgi:hypothetical protein
MQSNIKGLIDMEAELEEEDERAMAGMGAFGTSQMLLGKDGQLVDVRALVQHPQAFAFVV